ncbi:hypothetical protein GN956_G18419 [Arapaima gigas]
MNVESLISYTSPRLPLLLSGEVCEKPRPPGRCLCQSGGCEPRSAAPLISCSSPHLLLICSSSPRVRLALNFRLFCVPPDPAGSLLLRTFSTTVTVGRPALSLSSLSSLEVLGLQSCAQLLGF